MIYSKISYFYFTKKNLKNVGEIMNKKYILLLLLGATTILYSQEKDAAKDAQNPLANIISMPLQNNTSFGLGDDDDRTSNTLNIQPIYPVSLAINGCLLTVQLFQ